MSVRLHFRERVSRAIPWMLGLFFLTSTVSSQADNGSINRKLEPIRIQLKWRHQFQFAGFYMALEKGFYRDVGLDVELIEGGPEINPEDVVLDGQADFGIGTPEVLLSYAEGEPIVVLGVIFQHSPYIFLTTAESGIGDINALVDGKVMVEPQASELYAYLERERVPLERLNILPHSQSIYDLTSGKVQAMSAYATTEPFLLKDAGVAYHVFNPRSSGIDFYGDCIFTTQQLLDAKPDLVDRFYKATIKGWEYAMDQPDETIDLILEKWPTEASRAALEFEAQNMESLMHTELIPIGYMYSGRWEHIRDTYIELGMLDEAISLDDFLYDLDHETNWDWLYWLLGGVIATASISIGILLPIWKLNLRLRNELREHQRTGVLLVDAKEQAEKANHAKRQFVAQVSHDLRTPLNGILGFSELLHEDEKDIERRSYLAAINSAGKSLLSLVDELLHIDRIESGRVELNFIEFMIDDVLDSLIELLAPSARHKDIELLTRVEKPLSGFIHGDPEKLRQMLLNLLGNAIKFTDHGEVVIRVEQGEPGWLNFIVTDSGPGIPNDIIGGIFEPFVRARNIQHVDGCGLGLTIVHRLAHAMNGSITATNGERGAIFKLSLPLISDTPLKLENQPLFKDFQGVEIAVFLRKSAHCEATIANLTSLGANVINASNASGVARTCVLLIAEKGYIDKHTLSEFTQLGKPIVQIERDHPMMTRRYLARYILEATDGMRR